jgi:glycosyltransferase A (GT-A) superfamily protein (DUF2064 family)
MSGAIAIFVKTPEYSAVKTRLAAAVGTTHAVAWHRRAAATVAAAATDAARRCDAVVYWAVAESAALAARAWDDLPNLDQGEGGLGARMARVHGALVERHGCGLLLGADTPQLETAALVDALAWCASAGPRQAIGPARDGGFWLYGGNRVAAAARWEAVPYSRSDTGARFRAAFADLGAWLELARLTDVDEADDLLVVQRALAALPSPLPAQVALAGWLTETFGADAARVVGGTPA